MQKQEKAMRKTAKNKIDNDVLKTLDLLEDLAQEKVRHGFYQRLNYRIEHLEEEQEIAKASVFTRIIRLAATPALAAACIALGIFIGLGTTEIKTDDYVDTLVETYGIGLPETPQLFNTESQ